MTRDPELAHRLAMAVEAERSAATKFRARRDVDTARAWAESQLAVDALVEQVGAR